MTEIDRIIRQTRQVQSGKSIRQAMPSKRGSQQPKREDHSESCLMEDFERIMISVKEV
jgi:hypothetical protein